MAALPLVPDDRGFAGFAHESFAFLSGLAADNTRAWFRAHRDVYRTHVERPWRELVEAVAPALHTLLPELDCEVKTGHVLSRITARWPRPDAAYRSDLTAIFHPAGGGEWARRPRLFVTLAADGIRCGLEAPPRTAGWAALAEALRTAEAAPPLRAWSGRQPLGPGGSGVPHRGATLRLGREWPADVAVASGAELAAEVLAALGDAVPWYLHAARAAAGGGEALGEPPVIGGSQAQGASRADGEGLPQAAGAGPARGSGPADGEALPEAGGASPSRGAGPADGGDLPQTVGGGRSRCASPALGAAPADGERMPQAGGASPGRGAGPADSRGLPQAGGTSLGRSAGPAEGGALPQAGGASAARGAGPADGEALSQAVSASPARGAAPADGERLPQPADRGAGKGCEAPHASGQEGTPCSAADDLALAGLPRSLRAAIRTIATSEGVPPGVFVVYALARAVAASPQEA